MRKSIVVRRCESFIQTLERLGYRDQIGNGDLRYWISYTIGGDPRTVKRYLDRLRMLGYIRPTPNVSVWQLNLHPKRMVPVGQQLFLEAEEEEPP